MSAAPVARACKNDDRDGTTAGHACKIFDNNRLQASTAVAPVARLSDRDYKSVDPAVRSGIRSMSDEPGDILEIP